MYFYHISAFVCIKAYHIPAGAATKWAEENFRGVFPEIFDFSCSVPRIMLNYRI
jgi:hypothetical protein